MSAQESGGQTRAGQLIRSSTSAAPNYAEAQNAESRRDFIHKMKICLKELSETRVWLKFARRKDLCDRKPVEDALKESRELIRIFAKSVRTAQDNATRRE